MKRTYILPPIGTVLKEMRIKRGMSLRQMEDLTGLGTSYISSVELNKRLITTTTLYRFAKGLRYDAWRILRRAQKLQEKTQNDLQTDWC